MTEPQGEAYIVIGMPRTGTSLAMGLLSKMGVYTGVSRKGANNPNYYEAQILFDLINHKEGVTAEQVVKELSTGRDKWGMKHPTIANRWDEFQPFIERPRFVVCHRIDESAQYQSHIAAIRVQSLESFRRRARLYHDRVVEITDGHPVFHCNYEQWFSSSAQLRNLATFAGLKVTPEAADLIDPTLKHY